MKIGIFDAATGKEEIIELSPAEIAKIVEQDKEDQKPRLEAEAKFKQEAQAREAKRQSALAKLVALGLTEDEIAAL